MKILPLVLLVASFSLPAAAFAEGKSPAEIPVNKASDASFDKRLPPVLPGERMSDSGHDSRVWSTSGGVPVSEAPEPWKDKQMIDDFVRNSGVVVDARATAVPR